MDFNKWAVEQREELTKTVKFYIDNGIDKQKALKMVLGSSCLGKGHKSQIEYEIKYYEQN